MVSTTTETVRMLVVSREPSTLSPLWLIAEENCWRIETAASGWEALERVQTGSSLNLVVLDLARGDADGLHTLRWLRRVRPDLAIVLIAHPEDARQKSEAIRLGAQDYWVRPLNERSLERAIRDHLLLQDEDLGNEIASDDIEAVSNDQCFVAAGPATRKLRAQAHALAQIDAPVWLIGEAGSGKEVVARLIHKLSVRSGSRFIKVNCAALPEELQQTELFGQDRSALNPNGTPSKFEICERGTLFLDAITAMPAALQSRLAEALQQGHLVRNGQRIEIDVRVLAATGTHVERALKERKLREELYYWLSAFSVYVPPLRQRREEIPLLVGHFMIQLARHYGLQSRSCSPLLIDACQQHSWPGNLRELENFVKRYLVVGDEDLAMAELRRETDSTAVAAHRPASPDLDLAEAEFGFSEGEEPASGLKSLVQSVKGEAEKSAIAQALAQTHWNRKAAARLLQVSYRTLLYKIQQYHMNPPPAYLSAYNSEAAAKINEDGH